VREAPGASRGATDLNELKQIVHRKLLSETEFTVLQRLNRRQLAERIAYLTDVVATEGNISLTGRARQQTEQEVLYEVVGYGPIQTLLDDPDISEIMVNGPTQVFIERSGRLELTDRRFADDDHVMRIIEKIISPLGRRLDESVPMVDARLPDGSRVNAIIPPLALNGPCITIRKFAAERLTPTDLVGFGSMSPEMNDFLHACVQARLNTLVSGGTGSGKTTTLNVLSSFIPNDERIVTIEDAAELRLQQTHVARMETRPANVEGTGAIQIRQLVINALRMRPDRIIVGEVRAEEALDMLQAMNTGHDGSLTTIHANTPRDGLNRLEVMVGMASANMGIRSIRQQVASAVDLFVQVARFSDGARRITHITEVCGMEQDIITLQDIFLFDKTGMVEGGRVTGRFRATGIRPKFYDRLKSCGINLSPQLFQTVVEIN
jgi:pilus assembly protein CpaF